MTEAATVKKLGGPDQRSGARPILLALPLIVVVLGYFCMTLRTTQARLLRPWPTSALEVQFVMDAWRIVHDKPVYTDPAVDHATHMYGPLITYTTVPLVQRYGPDPRPPRYVSLGATVLLCLIAGAILVRHGGWMAGFLAIFLCYFQFYRLREWATGSRPDAHSLLLALVAMILFYRAWASDNLTRVTIWTVAGTVILLVGFFFKQTAAAVALVPPVVLLIQRRENLLKRLVISAIPFVAVAGTVLVLRIGWPWVYFHMVTVPAQYSIDWGMWVLGMLQLIRFDTLFLLAFVGWAMLILRERQADSLDLWLLTSIAVLALPCGIARAKWGGSYNSFLPVYLAMDLFTARIVLEILRQAASTRWPVARAWSVAILIPILLLVDLTFTGRVLSLTPAAARPTIRTSIKIMARALNPGSIALEHGGPNVLKVIDVAKSLPGKFISPDDPLIALHAAGYVGRTAAIELDANRHEVPAYLIDELRSADWVLQTARGWPSSVPDELLVSLGFAKTTDVIPRDAVYTLWRKPV